MYSNLATTARIARAFNEGSDARLAGLPRNTNPYWDRRGTVDGQLYRYWQHGWEHVACFWGNDARWNRYVRALPPVASTNGHTNGHLAIFGV